MKISFTLAAFLTAILILTSIIANAQEPDVKNPSTYDLQFGNPTYDCSAGTFCTDLQIKAADGADDFVMGAHTFYINYNQTVINEAEYTPIGITLETTCDIIAGVADYQPYSEINYSREEADSDTASLSIVVLLDAFVNGFECPVISEEWFTAGTACFNVIDANGNMSLVFNNTLTL